MDLKWTIVVLLLTSAILEVVSENGDKKRVWRKKKKNRKKWKNRAKNVHSEMETLATAVVPLLEKNKSPDKVKYKLGKSDDIPSKLK